MYWSFIYKGKKHYSWGKPRSLPENEITDLKPDYSVKIYSGEEIKKGEKVLFTMQGDSTLGLGDTIWLITFMREIYRIKGRRKCEMHFSSSKVMHEFYSNFLPLSFKFVPEFLTEEEFKSYDHFLPSMYYWKEDNVADKSWINNKSMLERLFDWTGMEYNSLSDFGEFTPKHIMYPDNDFYKKLGINKNEDYILFQWHSSGHSKNIPPKENIKIIKHLVKKYNKKVYIIGKLHCLDKLSKLQGVVNLSCKTTGLDIFTLAINSDFIISPESAGVHLGEAYRIPTVGILATIPPVYIANKYKIPTFIFGSGKCKHKPCGITQELVRDRCPPETGNYCNVLTDIDLNLLDKAIIKSFENRMAFGSKKPLNFYNALNEPISLT